MHDHPHHNSHTHSHRHNSGHDEHLHSHPHGDSGRARREELQVLAASLLEGFRQARDKTSFLRVAGIPFQRTAKDGTVMYLVDVTIESGYQVGTASPGFGSRELSYLPFPGELVGERETMKLTYVSLTERADVDIVDLVAARRETES